MYRRISSEVAIFAGTVMIDGAPVADGAEFIAMVNGHEVATTTEPPSRNSMYISLRLGEVIKFKINGQVANGSWTFRGGA